MSLKFLGPLVGAMFACGSFGLAKTSTDPLKEIPVLEGGRMKPFDTFARESLTLVTGKDHFGETPAQDVVMTWLLAPEEWNSKKFILVDSPVVRKSLGLPDAEKYYSPSDVEQMQNLSVVLLDLAAKREAKEKLNPYYQAVARLENEIVLYREWTQGRGVHLLPGKDGEWKTLAEFSPVEPTHFAEIARAFSRAIANGDATPNEDLKIAVQHWKDFVTELQPGAFSEPKMKAEIFYNSARPFRWAWILYFLSAGCLILAWILRARSFENFAWIPLIGGVILHILGFILRMTLTGRAPVSNMYETVVWVGLGSLFFSLVIYRIYRYSFLIFAGSMVAGFCLLLSDLAPVVLDGTLQPLEPVLRSNYWLTIHVLTITLSYAAFFLAFALGDIGLVLSFASSRTRSRNEKHFHSVDDENIQKISLGIYRAMQVGVSLLAPGIILGGIWADYSWGRFWGWDPKETWALIVLLGYLAILHARKGGLLRQFGLIVTSVLAFNLVIMAWYGVNFVLGAGLHSYGFGAGGIEYVTLFVALHFAFVAFVAVARKLKKVD